MDFFLRYYQNVDQSDVDDASTKMLCSYFDGLSDIMIDIESLLKTSNAGHTAVHAMRENVANLRRFLKIGNFIIEIEYVSHVLTTPNWRCSNVQIIKCV